MSLVVFLPVRLQGFYGWSIFVRSWIHRIRWWRLCSTTHIWTWRWLRSPSTEVQSLGQWCYWKSVIMITAEAALRCLSLAAVSFWHRGSSKLVAALSTEPRHFGLSIAYPSRSLGLMWRYWRLALTVSLYRSFGLPWFLLSIWSSPYIRRLSIRHSSIRITCPTHRSWALMMVASILVDLAWSRISRLVMCSYLLIPKMERRARMWKSSSFLICLRYSVHVSQPWEGRTTAL